MLKPFYVKDEYNFVVFHKAVDDVNDAIWSYEKTEEDAIRRVQIETDSYGNVEEYQFYYEKLIDDPLGGAPFLMSSVEKM